MYGLRQQLSAESYGCHWLCQEEGTKEQYGLTELGHQQASLAGYEIASQEANVLAMFGCSNDLNACWSRVQASMIDDTSPSLPSSLSSPETLLICRGEWKQRLGASASKSLHIYSSPFSRAQQTAADAAAAVGLGPSHIQVWILMPARRAVACQILPFKNWHPITSSSDGSQSLISLDEFPG